VPPLKRAAPGSGTIDMSKTDKPAPSAGRTIVRKRRNRWNEKRRQTFLMVLTETANVRQSAARAKMSLSAAYLLKERDPAFARAWREALEVGFSELEMLLLRDSIEGTERVEWMEIGPERELKYVKTIKSRPLAVGIRLFNAHREEVLAFRRERDAARDGGSDVGARVRAHMDEVRDRMIAQGLVPESDDEQGHDG
jgi:hypothetical protein